MAAETNAYDIIIAGGGTAGLVLASRLSEDPSLHVLALEAGQDVSELPEKLVQAVMTPAAHTQLYKTPVAWDLTTIPQDGLNGRHLKFPQGKMLGGSSGLNGLLFTASTKAVVDGWAELGNPGWAWSDFSQSLAQVYTLNKVPAVVEKPSSNSGPLQVSYADNYRGGWPKVWIESLQALGFPGAQDPLTSQNAGGLMVPETVDPTKGIRSFSANAYMSSEVRERTNLTIQTGVVVQQVLFENSNRGDIAVATGVKYFDQAAGTIKIATARREVVISAGVFGSPKLLELSGVGSAEHLRTRNLDVVVDLPGVGENLQNHPMITVSFEVSQGGLPTKDAFLRAAIRQDPQVLGPAMQEYMQHRTGVFASSGVTSAAQLPLPGIETPGGRTELENLIDTAVQTSSKTAFNIAHEKFVRSILLSPTEASGYYIFGPAYAAFGPDGTNGLPPMDGSDDSYITIALTLSHPLSRGSVHLLDGEADEPSLAINPRVLSHPLDLEVMARHLQFIERDLVTAQPLAKLLKPNGKRTIGCPSNGVLKDLETAKKYLKERAIGAHHYTGSCSMMPREMGGVVDSELRVYGTANLRVCDASVIPLTPRANPQATVYGIAEHGYKILRSNLFMRPVAQNK